MSYYIIKYEFKGQDSEDPGGEAGSDRVQRKCPVCSHFDGSFPIAVLVEKFLNRPFPGTKLDMPRLDPPRGPARGAARTSGV